MNPPLVEEALTEELWECALPGSPSIPLLPAVTSLVGVPGRDSLMVKEQRPFK